MVVGAAGGAKIIAVVAKAIIRALMLNETIKEAIDAPALYNQFIPYETVYETNTPAVLLKFTWIIINF